MKQVADDESTGQQERAQTYAWVGWGRRKPEKIITLVLLTTPYCVLLCVLVAHFVQKKYRNTLYCVLLAYVISKLKILKTGTI